MNKTDFAELKEKLTKIDYVAANAYLTRYMEGGYEEPTYQQYGDYIHGKSAAIISELIDIIQNQSEALGVSANQLLGVSLAIKEHGTNINPQFFIEHYDKFSKKAKSSLSETTTRLKKLRDGS